MKEMVNYLIERAEYNQNRYISDELFITDLMEMNWIQRAFSRGKIIRHLTAIIESHPPVLNQPSITMNKKRERK